MDVANKIKKIIYSIKDNQKQQSKKAVCNNKIKIYFLYKINSIKNRIMKELNYLKREIYNNYNKKKLIFHC
jgi:hypothetical protein